MALEHLFAQRLRELVDLAELRELLVSALRADNLERAFARHVAPGFARHAQAARASEAQLASLVGPEAHAAIVRIAQKLRPPPARWASTVAPPALVRQLLAPVWTQVLVNFAKRLPLPGTGAAGAAARSFGGLTSVLTRSVQEQAEKLVDRGRSLMGGLGGEVERRLVAAARDFSDSAAQLFREALAERLASEEGQRLVAAIAESAVDRVMQARLSELQADLDALPVTDVLELVPGLVSHALDAPFVRARVESELDAWLDLEGARTLAELLDESGQRAYVQELLARRLEQFATGLVHTAGFEHWLRELLEP